MSHILVLGAGKKARPGLPSDTVVAIDCNPNVGADIIHDLSLYPWPFKSDLFDEVVAEHIIEHLDDVVGCLEEIWRVCKPGARVRIVVPYFRSKWAALDPTHKRFFVADSMCLFVKGHDYCERYSYSHIRFKQTAVTWNEGIDQTWFQKLLIPIATNYTKFYENKLAPIWPLETLTYKLEVIKE